MNISNLFFIIHYCNGRRSNKSMTNVKKVVRTLQHHELIFISKGKGHIVIDKKGYQVKDGMLLYIAPDVPHSFALEKYYALTVHFSYARVNYFEGKWNIKNEMQMLSLPTAKELKEYYQIEDLFKKLVENWNAKLPGYEFTSKTLFQQLLAAIYLNIKKQHPNYSTSVKVEKVIQYMHQNINNKLTLPELARMVQLSPTYLSRVFKETTGYSVIEFFNQVKIDKAKELMIEGDVKVKEVAKLLGFTDEFYFSRLFKIKEGISPSEFCSKNVHG